MAKKQFHRRLSNDALDLVAARFRILGEPVRLALLQKLMDGEKNVSDLVARTGGTQANVSKHLSLLLQHGLVYKRREGVQIYYGIADPSIFQLCDMVCGGLQKQYQAHVKIVTE